MYGSSILRENESVMLPMSLLRFSSILERYTIDVIFLRGGRRIQLEGDTITVGWMMTSLAE